MMPNQMATVAAVAVYLGTVYSLAVVAWSLIANGLRSAPGGLRLAAVLLGQIVLTAVVVQSLGLLGILNAPTYIATCLSAAILTTCLRRDQGLHRSLWTLSTRTFQLWVLRPDRGRGLFLTGFLGWLALRAVLVEGMDSLTLHGPLVLQWIQQGKVELFWRWNYPLGWEYQFVPPFMLSQNDQLAIVPRLLAAIALLLLLRETGRRLRLDGVAAQLTSWIIVLTPMIWGLFGEGSLKNDLAVALGLLAGILALERAFRKVPGAFLLLQLACFILISTKTPGTLYAGFLFCGFFLAAIRGSEASLGRRIRQLLPLVGLTFLFQSIAAAAQIANTCKNGSPFYPIAISFAGFELLPGTVSTEGTSIFGNLGRLATWAEAADGGSKRIGFEFPALWVFFVIALIIQGVREVRSRHLPLTPRRRSSLVFGLSTAFLWVAATITPWSASLIPGSTNKLAQGLSFRYAIAAVGLTYLWTLTTASASLGPKRKAWLPALLTVSLIPILCWRWSGILIANSTSEAGMRMLGLLAGAWLLAAAFSILVNSLLLPLVAGLRSPWRIAVSLLCFLMIVPGFTWWVEQSRQDHWGRSSQKVSGFRPIWEYVGSSMPETATIAHNESLPLMSYFLFGPRFQYRLLPVGDPTLAQSVISSDVDYFYLSQRRPEQLSESQASLERMGWKTVASAESSPGILLERSKKP